MRKFNIRVAACDANGRKDRRDFQIIAIDYSAAYSQGLKLLSSLLSTMGRNGLIEVEGGLKVSPTGG